MDERCFLDGLEKLSETSKVGYNLDDYSRGEKSTLIDRVENAAEEYDKIKFGNIVSVVNNMLWELHPENYDRENEDLTDHLPKEKEIERALDIYGNGEFFDERRSARGGLMEYLESGREEKRLD
jgi:hypothetical protein